MKHRAVVWSSIFVLFLCSLESLQASENHADAILSYAIKPVEELCSMSNSALIQHADITNKIVHKKVTHWEEENHYTLTGGILASGATGTALSTALLIGLSSLLNIDLEAHSAVTMSALPGCLCAVLFALACRPTFPEDQQLKEVHQILHKRRRMAPDA